MGDNSRRLKQICLATTHLVNLASGIPRYWTVSFLMLSLAGVSSGLVCWHCIAENCDISPDDNYRAERRRCMEGQTCQKVYFEMQSDTDDTKYRSTVRSCAEDCVPQDDFTDCDSILYTTRGCVRRACCGDDDLCNAGRASSQPWPALQVLIMATLAFSLPWLLGWRSYRDVVNLRVS